MSPLPPFALRSPTTWLLLAAVLLSSIALRPLVWEIGAGMVLGYLSERPVDWTLRHLRRQGRPRWRWAVSTSFAVVVSAVFLVPAVVAVWVALRELGQLAVTTDLERIARAPGAVTTWLRLRLGALGVSLPTAEVAARARSLVEGAGAGVARVTGRVLAGAPGVLLSTFVVLTAWVNFAVEGPALRERVLARVLPWPRLRAALRETTAEVIDSVVLANLGVSCIQAAIVTVASLALRVPHAVVWGVASFVLSFVPVVGTGLVTGSAALYLFLSGRIGATVAMGVVAVLAGSVDNVLRPVLARGSTRLPFFWMMVAIVGGILAFGVPGVILGPLLLSYAVALWEARDEAPETPGTPEAGAGEGVAPEAHAGEVTGAARTVAPALRA